MTDSEKLAQLIAKCDNMLARIKTTPKGSPAYYELRAEADQIRWKGKPLLNKPLKDSVKTR